MSSVEMAFPKPAWLEQTQAMRFPAGDEVEIELLDEPGVTFNGYLRDASSSSVRLGVPRALPAGSEVMIRLGERLTIEGEVTYCRSARTVHYAGVAIRRGSGRL